MRKKQQPLDDFLKVNNNYKKVYFDRDSGIVTETESDFEYTTKLKNNNNFIFSDDEEQPTKPIMSISNELMSPNYYSHLGDQAVLTIKDVLKIDSKSWKKVLKHKSGTTVYTLQQQQKDEKLALFKGEAIIEGFTPQSIFYVIGMRKLWDDQFDEGKLIENLNDTTSITYESYKSTATSKAYDLSLVEKIECSLDGEILFACTSIDTPKAPKITGKNRHHIKLQGWILKQLQTVPVSTKVTFITQESIKGWIPGLTKKSLARKPLIIASIDHYLKKKADRLKLQKLPSIPHPPEHISFQPPPPPPPPLIQNHNIIPSISITNSPEPTQKPSILVHHPNLSSSSVILSNPPPRISSLVSSTNSTKRITFAETVQSSSSPEPTSTSSSARSSTTEPNHLKINTKATEHHAPPVISRTKLYPASRHRQERKECLERLKSYATITGWKKTGERNQTSTFILPSSDPTNPLPIMKGVTHFIGDWTPEQICSVIQCFGARKVWDDYFDEGQVIERFSQKEYLVYIKMKSLFPIQSRDFSILSCIESHMSGVVYVGSISVGDVLIPEQKNHTRGFYLLYGWILEPIRGGVRATMLMELKMGGQTALPASISRIFTQQVPFYGDRIGDYLNHTGCPPYVRRVAGKIIQERFESNVYQIEFTAKHAPSSRRREKRKTIDSMWCTDLRIHASVYPYGCDIETNALEGIRVEMRPDGSGVRIFTENLELDGQTVELKIMPRETEGYPVYRWNGLVVLDLTPKEDHVIRKRSTVFFDPIPDTLSHLKEDLEVKQIMDKHTSEMIEQEILKRERRNSQIIVLNEELSFTANQFSFVVLLMIICYYLGKVSCRCSI